MADEENYSLKIEVKEVMKEISFAVKHVQLSESLENEDEKVFFNLETKESHRYCIELTPKGFRVGCPFLPSNYLLILWSSFNTKHKCFHFNHKNATVLKYKQSANAFTDNVTVLVTS